MGFLSAFFDNLFQFLDFTGAMLFDILFSGFGWYLHFSYTSFTSEFFCYFAFWYVTFGLSRYFCFFTLFYGFFFIMISLFNCLFFSLDPQDILFLAFKSFFHLANNHAFFNAHLVTFLALGLQWTFIYSTWKYKVSR